MSPSMPAEPVAPQRIAGGFVLVPVPMLLNAWRACRCRPLGIGDFRTWLACREMIARRCTAVDGRSPTFGHAEVARLTGVSEKRARSSIHRLVGAGLLNWSVEAIEFVDRGTPIDDDLADSIGGGRGSLTIPRRVLRFLADGARPALIAAVLAILLRCLSRGRGGFKSRGRVKASWIARVFGVDLRRAKQARKELIARGWIAPEPTNPWAENSWGRAYTIDLGWAAGRPGPGRRLPPPPAPDGRRLPPPESDPEPLREEKHQEPAPGGSAGFRIPEAVEEQSPRPTLPMPGASAVLVPRLARTLEPACPPPTPAARGAGGGPLPAPVLDDVRVEDLKETGRLLVLLTQAIARDLVGTSEADRLRFVAAAEHAMTVGKGNPPGLFLHLVRGRLWRYLTQEDEDRASTRLRGHLFGGPRRVVPIPPRRPSDAEVVREVRATAIRLGYFRDPFAPFQASHPDWTRERWDRALVELGL